MMFTGVWVAALTPFKADESVDFEWFEKHLRFLFENKVTGVVPCGTTGEGATLRTEEKHELFKLSLQVAKSYHAGVMASCGGPDTKLVLENIEQAAKIGCTTAMVVTPYYNRPTPSGLLAHYTYLADRASVPLVLYHVPGRTGTFMPVETTAELLKHKNILGVKEASGQYSYWLALSRLMNTEKKSLIAGDDDAYAMISALGGSGLISATANWIPKAFVTMAHLIKEKKWDEVFSLQKKVSPIVRAAFLETSPAPLKYALSWSQQFPSYLRLPLVSVKPETELALKSAYEVFQREL